MTERIYSRQFHGEEGTTDWRVLPEGASAFFRTDTFAASRPPRHPRPLAAVRLERPVAVVGDGDAPAPDVDIRGEGVTVLVRAFKGKEYGLEQRDLDLARAISGAAGEMGLTAEPAAVESLLIIPGALDRTEIMPFWKAVLGYQPRPDSPDEDLVDPHDRLAPLWFEEMDELRPDGAGTIHLVVWVPWDEVVARVEAGLEAGGRVVRHNVEEGFWTLADPAGNEVDVTSTSAPDQSG